MPLPGIGRRPFGPEFLHQKTRWDALPPGPTNWFVRKTGNDNNGGSSATVRSTGTDGVTNNNNTLNSAGASWSAADVGHGIFIGGVNVWRKIVSVSGPGALTFSGATIASASGRTWTIGGAWVTIGKSMASTVPVSAGDTVYIGAGNYRETITLAQLSSGNVISWVGDVDGAKTGDVGEVILTGYTTNDRTVSASTLITAAGVSGFYFKFITFVTGAGNILAMSQSCMNFTFYKCVFLSVSASTLVSLATTYPCSTTFDSCIFFGSQGNIITAQMNEATADYNCGIVIKNCLFIGGTNSVVVNSAGVGAGFGGGLSMLNCTGLGVSQMLHTNAASGLSTSIPVTMYNCICITQTTGINAGAAGQITEDYNLILAATARTNVTAGAHSISDNSYAPLLEFGQSWLYGFVPRPLCVPRIASPALGFGNQAGGPTVDLLSSPRTTGEITLADFGTATGSAASALNDTTKNWGTNAWVGYVIKITGGTGSGQLKTIQINTQTSLNVDGNWKTQPSTDSTYVIYDGAMASSGKATAGSTTTLTDINAAWGTNMWQGYTVKIDGGTGSGNSAVVTSNTATVLTFANIGATLDNTSTYQLYRGTDGNTVNNSVGCFERANVAVRETVTVQTGANSWRIQGAGYQDFQVPVNALTTRISIYGRYDSFYAGTLPCLCILNGTECGVADVTSPMFGAANQWEQIVVDINPTAIGIITVRIRSNSTTPTGTAFFDTEVTT